MRSLPRFTTMWAITVCPSRTVLRHGIQLPLAKYVISGDTYDFKVYVKQDMGSEQTIDLGIQYNDVDGKPQYAMNDKSGKKCASGERRFIGYRNYPL